MATVNEFYSDIAFHPGETLTEKLEELKMGPKEFAIRTGKPEKTIIAILKGDSSITPEMAILFESVLKIPASFWIKRQFSFDEFKAREKRALTVEEAKDWAKRFPIADMVKCQWLNAKTKVEEKVEELFHFFGVSSPDAWKDYFFNQQLKVAFRISLAHTKEPYAISAWIRQGEIQANRLNCGAYSEAKFKKTLKEIKTIMATQPDNFFEQLQQLCLACGVKVVYTPCIKKAPLSGATRWIDDNPLIQLTGRYKQNDRFWFTFFHEAGHILLHGKKDIFLEDIDYSDADLQKEAEANNFAVEWTFSNEQEEEVLNATPLTIENIEEFAKLFNTHPAMIIGRFHKKGLLHYAEGRDFFVKLEFSDN
ncbi:putative addiction module antidote protein HigA [Sphingobacterium spiritivorum ATCC 33300]|uniref:Putative addiction module antidote protein HigA n=1 Tax=Sphingobacterium spiritivorum ATCC 33300 TaxID=525372 RepID=C2G1E9_SPHSI|nr:ImmA/IrrE family metallo-endopeptidase [Sphingobacterium spiritivorum]EEI90858.1 putative addiction module antidote protein HigA [Sphingobacterium spiritivorum ATCC 33300]QQS97749.1 ImmA/IrrE family metallo-endopeptidase [Sphingobacterium spiritivorum]